ncbi:MAG: hypothetical protein ACI88G_000160 [Woeseiaceae bacterium]|jgi:hypothetical protein
MRNSILKYMCMRGVLVSIVAIFCLPQAANAQDFTPHSAEYKIKISVLGGRLTTRFERTDDGFTAKSVIKATGMSRLLAHGEIHEQSWFEEHGDKIRPSRYLSSDSLSKNGTDVDLEFDWSEQLVSGMIGGEDFQTDIGGALHDRVSLQYALMLDLINGKYDDFYSLQDAEKLKLLSVTNVGSKSVKVPYGTFEAVGLQHRAGTSSRVTTMWFAQELGYLPVMIEQHRKGKLKVRAVLSNYVPDTADAAESVAHE